MPIDRLILPGRGSFWKSSFRLRIGSPPNGSTCSNIVVVLGRERRFDVALQGRGRIVRCIALDDLAVLADQKLGEVPLGRLRAEDGGRLGGEPLPEWMRLVAVDLDLAHHRKARSEEHTPELQSLRHL